MKSLENRAGKVRWKLVVLLAAIASCAWGYLRLFDEPPKPLPYSTPPNRNTKPEVAYVGDKVCAGCHAAIAEAYSHHPMAHSMTTAEKILPEASGKVAEFRDLSYWIERRDGRIFHQERKTSPNGKVVEKTEHEVRYVIGSGTIGHVFLVERDNKLFQSPIWWYARDKAWDLTPSYWENNQHFNREITDECLFCHANRAEKVEGKSVKFDGLAIGCERCHGPGEFHARDPKIVTGGEATIVNPAKLQPVALRENVCEQCHFHGFRRDLQRGVSLWDYRPGLPLDNFLVIRAERFGLTKKIQASGHVEQMRKSRCYEASNTKLGCISCHDPHRVPDAQERISYYQKRCLECHADSGCKLPRDTRLQKNPADDCISCHMPRLPLRSNIGHTAVTDHSIPRNSSE